MDKSAEFSALKGEPNNFNLKYVGIQPIDVGFEGQKMIAQIISKKGKHGTYFIKEASYKEEDDYAYQGIRTQEKKYRQFREGGVLVPHLFKGANTKDGKSFLISSDLSQNGHYQVLSWNNPEIKTDFYEKLKRNIPLETKVKLQQQIERACRVAAKMESTHANWDLLRMQGCPYALVIDPQNPADANMYIADFGRDIAVNNWFSSEDVYRENLQNGAQFYKQMIGSKFMPIKHSRRGETSAR